MRRLASKAYWVKRLSEPSTYIGLMGLFVLLGWSEDQFKEVASAIAGVFGFVLIFLEEK